MKRNKKALRSHKKKKYYIILSKKDRFQYGVFPYSKDGLKKAKEYLVKITTKPQLYTIKSK